MGLESPFAYGGCGPWFNRLQRRVLGAPPPLERDFCAHFALACLSCPSRRLLTSPSARLSGTLYVAAAASDGALAPARIPDIAAAVAAVAASFSSAAVALFGRFCGAQNCAPCYVCVPCGVDFGRCELQATPARVLAAQAWPGGGLRAFRGRRERQRRPGRAAARVRSVVLCVRPISGKTRGVYWTGTRVYRGVSECSWVFWSSLTHLL
jgi:hypothetical protein